MFIRFRDIIKLGYFWYFRLKSSNDYQVYQSVKSKILIDYLKKHIEKRGKMLEVGVQGGEMTRFFKELSSSIVSIDIDTTHLRLAKKNNPYSEVICCDILHPPFKENVFDVVVLNSVIEHIPDEENALKAIYKLMENKGYLYIGFPPWYGIFGGHSSIPFFSILPLKIRKKLSRYKFVRAYPTSPRSVRSLMKKIDEFFYLQDFNSLFLPNAIIRYPLYEIDFFITFICKKRHSKDVCQNKDLIQKREFNKSNITELRGYWSKTDFHLK